MKLEVSPGKYIVAVSGGVDSMVLLHLLHSYPGLELVVAHFDHGIRPDSSIDRQLVETVAREYGLPFLFAEGGLGPGVSEAQARQARYAFLRQVMKEQEALAIITAHHQDDLLETVAHNLIRGTGRTGLSALRSSNDIIRPLLGNTKAEIRQYAQEHTLRWREDSTNEDLTYTRNYLRQVVLKQASQTSKAQLLAKAQKIHSLNQEINDLLDEYLAEHSSEGKLDRRAFIMLSHRVATEVMAAWLRSHQIRHFDRKTIERLTSAAKTLRPGKQAEVLDGVKMVVGKSDLALSHHER